MSKGREATVSEISIVSDMKRVVEISVGGKEDKLASLRIQQASLRMQCLNKEPQCKDSNRR